MSAVRFDYTLAGAVLDFFVRADDDGQRELLAFFRDLAAHPTRKGDYAVVRDGRTNEVVQHGRFLVTYWPDHAVCELRITEVVWS